MIQRLNRRIDSQTATDGEDSPGMTVRMTTTIQQSDSAYTPSGIYRDIWGRRDFAILLSGPAGTGKSVFVLNWLFIEAAD